jgi:hypothetical protein
MRFISIILLLTSITAAQNLSNSVYIGAAFGTNVGGSVGVGVELMLNKYISASFAVGSIHLNLEEDVDQSKFDFDIGMKFYPIRYLYFGINYGLIDYVYSAFGDGNGADDVYYKETRGFSFTIGGRTPNYQNFYLSGFIGLTDDDEANHGFRVLEDDSLTPRIGLLLGYELN